MNLDLSPLWISLKISILATIITFFVGLCAANWMLTYRGKLRGLIDGILISPLVLPPTVVGFLLLLLLGRNGPVGQFLHQFDLNIIFTWEAAVITATVVSFPLMYRTSLGAFEQIQPNVILAARTLGASELNIFWQVMIPLSYRGIVAATILSFARALGEFGATLMLAGNIPGQTQTMPLAIFFATESGDYHQALIWVLILLSISLSVIITVNFWAESKKVRRTIDRKGLGSIWKSKASQHTPRSAASSSGLLVDIRKQYPDFSLDVNLDANGDPLGLLGASGSGKSMTLRCIAGLETPDKGKIIINGQVVFDHARKINIPSSKRRVGFVFQNYALFPHLNVWENIAFGIRKLPRTEQKRRIEEQIENMKLQGLERRYPYQISGGQQQRVALARALAIEPEILLLDEPFSALDTQLRSQMEKNLIETLATYKGTTLMVSHNLEEIYRVCENLLVISEGKVLVCGDKQDIFERPNTYEIAQLTGCKNFSKAQAISANQVQALDWNCTLNVVESIPESLSYIGIRAHHFRFVELELLKSQHQPIQENIFPCWLVHKSETPHRMTLYIKLNSPPNKPNDYHVHVELFKENWSILKSLPYPWHIRLDPLSLFLMES